MKRSEIRKYADSGNREALESYIRSNKRIANKRISNIEKALGKGTMRSHALNIARENLSSIDRSNFGGNLSKMTTEQLEKQALDLHSFLSRKTSSLRGVHERERKTAKYLAQIGRMPEVEDLDKFWEIMANGLVSEYYNVDSAEVIKAAARWANDASFNAIEKAKEIMQKWERKEIRYINDAFELINEAYEDNTSTN